MLINALGLVLRPITLLIRLEIERSEYTEQNVTSGRPRVGHV